MAGSCVTLSTLNRALGDVRDELCELDLLTKRLDKVDVILVSPFILEVLYGYYIEKSYFFLEWLGWEPGHIYIPSVKLSIFLSVFGYRDSFSLRHVLRHEYGHALAHRHPSLLKRSKDFTLIFGGRYDRRTRVDKYDPIMHVSEYASKNPSEDFAETFALYVRSNGNISRYSHLAGIFMKLLFVHNLCEKLNEQL